MEEIMTIEEASEKYCIPIKILKEYESMDLCKTVKRVMGEWHYNDEDIYVIGGDSIYRQMLPFCNVAHVTKMDYAYQPDTWIPNL